MCVCVCVCVCMEKEAKQWPESIESCSDQPVPEPRPPALERGSHSGQTGWQHRWSTSPRQPAQEDGATCCAVYGSVVEERSCSLIAVYHMKTCCHGIATKLYPCTKYRAAGMRST